MELLIFTIVALSVFVGLAVDRLYESRRRKSQRRKFFGSESDDADLGMDPELARECLAAINGLTASVDDNVVRHASRVAEISDGLRFENSGDANVVLAAAAKLIDANRQLQTELASAKDEIEIQQRQIHEYMNEARTDELTGLANRRAFEQELGRAVALWHRKESPLSLLVIDVDHFKRFNDYHGHQVGDIVLQRVAQVMSSGLREMDFVARFGGEEFAVILPATTQCDALTVAERIRVRIAAEILRHDEKQLRITVSVGVAQALPDEKKAKFVKRADSALYAAKNGGRNCTAFCNGDRHRLITPAYDDITSEPQAVTIGV